MALLFTALSRSGPESEVTIMPFVAYPEMPLYRGNLLYWIGLGEVINWASFGIIILPESCSICIKPGK